MKFKKIKKTKNGIAIEYTNKAGDTISLVSFDEPLQSFNDALQELKYYFIDIAELNSNDDVEIIGVSLSENKNSEQQVVMSGFRTLSTGKKLLINTPVTNEENWSDALVKAVLDIKNEASRYIAGSRNFKQEVLFDADFDKSDEELKNNIKNNEFIEIQKQEVKLSLVS